MIRDPKTIDDIKANREEWAQALESGEYKQGRGELRADGKHCCLGVLCDLYDPDGWRRIGSKYHHGIARANQIPDIPILQSVGILGSDHNDTETFFKYPTLLAVANDNGTPFTAIARSIRNAPLPEEVPS